MSLHHDMTGKSSIMYSWKNISRVLTLIKHLFVILTAVSSLCVEVKQKKGIVILMPFEGFRSRVKKVKKLKSFRQI